MFDWYPLFSLPEFEASGLVSKTAEVILEGIGSKEILVTKGNTIRITYEGIFLPVNFESRNPFERDGVAVYVDDAELVWLGIEQEG